MSGEDPSIKAVMSRPRLAIIGGGSSGLICLKNAIDSLTDWDIVCFEKSDQITGCWGDPYPGFVSTSTKYSTQFACFPLFDASVKSDGGRSRNEFFRDDEYGQYLEGFAAKFSLHSNVALHSQVDSILRNTTGAGWDLTITRTIDGRPKTRTEYFDSVILCSGLAAEPKMLDCDIERLSVSELNHRDGLGHVINKCIVVIGGGESAVDYANRLASPELNNEVFLSLQSGIRVSPRYHPIRGVPSDFLRNRLMLSIQADLRNWIGQRFVVARIKYQRAFEWFFPSSHLKSDSTAAPTDAVQRDVDQKRKRWAYKLTKTAKDDLFNMFHNKSDDFLNAVADGRITIVGTPVDNQFTSFHGFDNNCEEEVVPDVVVPAIGYRAQLEELSAGDVRLADFYMGCCHVTYPDLYLVGFARPIIGNIPTISEVQARYVCGLIAGEIPRPPRIEALHQADRASRTRRYKKVNMDAVYPVEMFPYCDKLAKMMNTFPSLFAVGSLLSWWRMQLAPATTLHYAYSDAESRERYRSAAIYMPATLALLLLMLKPLNLVYRVFRGLRNIGKSIY
ncbi:MAG: NAD(P)/FAD-dependent oxidoreductase [Planctomycetaceae bacterium]|nr:NAD(P)/FAD-dependent oxidoreductase [Planctomycetaceae bacterium]